ncbi:helix-turn-helix domain-containing protein [Roseateles sp.]|uniref:helix-turn-helix domain-containing protein n=1 Tax=Roseateles sp. TaxID=1971397 RepID=UPI0039E8F583
MPDDDRDDIVREFYGRIVQRLEIEPVEQAPVHIEARAFVLPGVSVATGAVSAMTGQRTAAMRSDGNSDVFLSFARHGVLVREAGAPEVQVAPGDVILTSLDRPVSFVMPRLRNDLLTLQLSRQALAPLLSGLDDRLVGSLPGHLPALQLLQSYASSLFLLPALPVGVSDAVGRHLVELAALGLGAGSEAQQQADRGGVRAARLAQAKAQALAHLDSAGLSAGFIAARLGVSSRYLHMLFENEGYTFSTFVLHQRLARARALLLDPRQGRRRILDIALDVGFGDIRTFNRAYRKHYGMTPSEQRSVSGA